VVGPRGKAGRCEQRRNAQCRPLQGHVDDRRAWRAFAQPVDELLVPFGRAGRCGQHGEVGPVEARDDSVGLLDPEAGTDVCDDRRRRGGSQREHALGPELVCAHSELQVVGAEVVPPLGDAVRLVDGEERDLRVSELCEEPLVVEALRRDVEQLQAPGAEALGDAANLVGAEARVEPRGVDSATGEEVDLVLHQRDQRRDDDGDAVE